MAERKMSENKKAPTTDPRGRCGTTAGYQAHRRRGERACKACLGAHSTANRARSKGQKAVLSPPAKPRKTSMTLDQLEGVETGTNDPRPVELPPEPAPKPPREPFKRADSAETAPDKPAPAKRAKATALPKVPEGVPTPPDWLKARGLELWIEVTQAHDLNASALVLLGEACRTADRLERMAAALSSRTTMWFEIGDIDQATELGVPVIVNGMIGEARQLQTSLRQTLTTLGVLKVDAAEKVAKSPLDQLAERRKKRLAAQGGGS